MTPRYNIDWLIENINDGKTLKYLFFWGHTKSGEKIGKSCLSQWYNSPFKIDGITYNTAEHWVMAHKALLFGDTNSFNCIIEAETPKQAKEMGRNILYFDEDIWNAFRFDIVKRGNIHKFNQHSELAEYLLSTGGKILVEASPVDTVWGIGLSHDSQHVDNPYFWRGLNLLGFVLMEVRDFLKEFGHFTEPQMTVEVPWKLYPAIDPIDMFWRMGKGEEAVIKFGKYYSTLSNKEKEIVKLTRPAPIDWRNFYNE